jgi:hypothetical protein
MKEYELVRQTQREKMAHSNNLATVMKEETTSKQLTELMKEILQTINAPEDTRKRLREK